MKKRRLLSLALCVAMLCSLVGVPTYADAAPLPTVQPEEATVVGIEGESSEEETAIENQDLLLKASLEGADEEAEPQAETEPAPAANATEAGTEQATSTTDGAVAGDVNAASSDDAEGAPSDGSVGEEPSVEGSTDEPQDGESAEESGDLTGDEGSSEDDASGEVESEETSDPAADADSEVVDEEQTPVGGDAETDTPAEGQTEVGNMPEGEQTEVGGTADEDEPVDVPAVNTYAASASTMAAVAGPTISVQSQGEHSGNRNCGAVTVTVNAPAGIESFTVNGVSQSGNTFTASAAPTGDKAFDQVLYSIDVTDKNGKTASTSFYVGHLGYLRIDRIDVPPTCTEKGGYNQEFYCRTCGKMVLTLEDPKWRNIPALGHDFGEGADTGSFTCGEAKGTYKVCKRCGYKEYTSSDGAPLTHTWGEQQTKAPTCTLEGYDYQECTVCHAIKIIEGTGTHALGHNMRYYYKAPTCTEEGTAYNACEREGCDYKTDERTIQVLEHVFKKYDSTAAGHRYVCANCGAADPAAPGYQEHTASATTYCTEDVKCSVCGYTISTGAAAHTLAYVEANDQQHQLRCTNANCSYTETASHRYPTNKDDCTAEVACLDCGHKMTPNLTHDYSETWKTDKTGHYHQCSRCSAKLDFAEHTPDHTGVGCTERFTCGICGYVMSSGYASHEWGEWQPIDAKTHRRSCTRDGCPAVETASHGSTVVIDQVTTPATCDQSGVRQTTTVCRDCRYVIKAPKNWTLPATGHKFSDWETVQGDACTEGSYQQRSCSVCGKVEYKDKVEGQHIWSEEKEIVQAATCTAKGTKAFKCTRCGAYKPDSYEDIPPIEHKLSEQPIRVVPETCMKDRVEVHSCEMCKAEFTTIVSGTALTHEFGDYTTNNDATCTMDATQSAHCVHCGAVDVKPMPGTKLGHAFQEDGDCTTSDPCVRCGARSTPKSGHAYLSWVDDPSQNQHSRKCTHEGCNHVESASHVASPNDDDCTTPVVCTICGAKLGLGLSNHNFPEKWSHDAQSHHRSCQNEGCSVSESYAHDKIATVTRVEVEPDCDDPGTEVILTFCATCNYELSREEKTLEPTGHKFGDWEPLDAPTCDDAGSRQRKCTECGVIETDIVNANGHDWELVHQIDQPATCTSAGSESIHCKNCPATKDARTIPAIPHNFEPVKVLQEANCTDNLIEEVQCQYCGEISIRTQEGSAWGHDFDDYAPLYDATCTEDGHEKGYCTRCDEVDVRVLPGSALGHTSSEDSLRVVKAPTCTEPGEGELVCERCGETCETGVAIPATGHNFPETWTGDAQGHHRSCQNEGCSERESQAHGPLWSTTRVDVEPDCDEPGLEVTLTFCTTCGYEVSREEKTLEATGHTFGDWEELDAPDCDDAGSRQRKCTVCGIIETDIVNANGHDWEEEYTVDQEATCQAAGSESIHCKKCEATKDARSIPALPHDYTLVRVLQEANCTENQIEEVACKFCSTTAVHTQEGTALGHDFANYESMNDATCTENGHEKGYCTRCDEVDVRLLPGSALGHDFTAYESMNDATCTQDGHEQSRCTRCGMVEERLLPGSALGHTPTSAGRVELTAPTCTAPGSAAYICVRCGAAYDEQVLPALGHKPVEEASQAATCTQAGYTGGSVCSVCGATLRARATIAALGYSYGAWTSNGNGSHSQRCTRCGDARNENCSYSEISIGATKVLVCKVCGDVVDPSNGETVTAGSFEVVAEAAAEEVDPGAIPSGCELIVRKLDIPFQDVEQVLEAFTVGCELDGKAFPLNGFIRVTMPVDCQMPFKLIRVDEDEDPQTGEMVQTTVEIEFNYEDGHITFETDRDGIFLLTKLDEEA